MCRPTPPAGTDAATTTSATTSATDALRTLAPATPAAAVTVPEVGKTAVMTAAAVMMAGGKAAFKQEAVPAPGGVHRTSAPSPAGAPPSSAGGGHGTAGDWRDVVRRHAELSRRLRSNQLVRGQGAGGG